MQRKRKRKRRCGGGGARVYRIDVREQAGKAGVCVSANEASRHPYVAFRIYFHGVRIRMLVEMK
jgi:hypothetical protein